MPLVVRTIVSRLPRRYTAFLLVVVPLISSLALFSIYYNYHEEPPRPYQLRVRSKLQYTQSPLPTPQILLVSAFYPLAKSKHTIDEYKAWLALFLGPITTEIYFFTSPEWEPMIRALRSDLPIFINTSFATPFDIPPLVARKEQYQRMHAFDREANIHSPELYAAWTAKTYFLREAMRNANTSTVEHAQFAFWTDAGAFRRQHFWRDWPDNTRIQQVWAEGMRNNGMKAEDLMFFPLQDLPDKRIKAWREDWGPIDNSVSEGSFFGGMPQAIEWWYDLYYLYHDAWLDAGHFVGKDQTVFNALFLLYPAHFIGVWLFDRTCPAALPSGESLATPLGQCLDSWFYYVFFLGAESERTQIADLWREGAPKQKPCGLTNVTIMEIFLARAFGIKWVPPQTSLNVMNI